MRPISRTRCASTTVARRSLPLDTPSAEHTEAASGAVQSFVQDQHCWDTASVGSMGEARDVQWRGAQRSGLAMGKNCATFTGPRNARRRGAGARHAHLHDLWRDAWGLLVLILMMDALNNSTADSNHQGPDSSFGMGGFGLGWLLGRPAPASAHTDHRTVSLDILLCPVSKFTPIVGFCSFWFWVFMIYLTSVNGMCHPPPAVVDSQ